MITLNLAYPERSDIKYEIICFPDGHKHLKLIQSPYDQSDEINVISRFTSYDDLFLIAQARKILGKLDNSLINLIIPYLLTGRCDRRFSLFESDDLSITIFLLNSLEFNKITTIDQHPVLNIKKIHNKQVFYGFDDYMNHICGIHRYLCQKYPKDFMDWRRKNFIEAFPDKSACKKYSNYEIHEIFAKKERDENGKIINMQLVNFDKVKDKNIIVRDDLIDGGATFIEFAKLLKANGANKLYLFVTHGIFSKGFDEILNYYEHIWCANSYKDVEHPNITCIDVYN